MIRFVRLSPAPLDSGFAADGTHSARSESYLYFTAETIENTEENEIKQAYEEARQTGLPVVYGERIDEGVYHFHPTNQQVREWAQQAGFEVLKEGNDEIWYYHILLRKVLEK